MTSRGPADRVRFGEFRLDPSNLRLWRGERVCRLTPKAFAVLDFLVARPGQLVSKDALLTALWPDVTVSEAALTVCIREVRRVLRDDARRPRFVETVHRRGFRFIGEVTAIEESAAPQPTAAHPTATRAIVARDAEVGRLGAWFARARQSERQVVFVTGEAGIGKTTVVETFLAGLTGPDTPWIARGQCIEYLGEGEAYLPVLDEREAKGASARRGRAALPAAGGRARGGAPRAVRAELARTDAKPGEPQGGEPASTSDRGRDAGPHAARDG